MHVWQCKLCVPDHVVGSVTVRPMDCKVASVRDFNVPQTKKDVMSFLGLCGYYRNYAKLLNHGNPFDRANQKEDAQQS